MIELTDDRITKGTLWKYLVIFTLWFLAFSPIYPELFNIWRNKPDDSHGLLVPFVVIYLLWQKRNDLQNTTFSNSSFGLAILVVSTSLYLLALAGGVAVAARAMMVFSLVGLALYTMGPKAFKSVAFPLFFLLFMIPVPDTLLSLISFPLQLFATKASEAFIRFLSIPVYREGNILYFTQTQLEVVGACSGIRSIMALLMLSTLFVYVMARGNWGKKTILLASAIPIALLANIFRITGTGVLTHFYGDQVAQGFLHDFSSLIVFAFGFTILFGEFLILSRPPRNSA